MKDADLNTLVFYGLSNCDKCRKARKHLDALNISYSYRDVRADGIDPHDLTDILAQCGAAALNTRSTTWRELSDEERTQDVHQLILYNPTLLKRPAIAINGIWDLGWPQARLSDTPA